MILLLKFWRESLIAVLLVAAVAMFELHERAVEERGRLQERFRVADSTIKAVRPAMVKAETAIVTKTKLIVRLGSLIRHDTAWRSDTVFAPTDTARANPSLPIPVTTLVRYDSLATAAVALADSCNLFRVAATTTIRALEVKVAAAPKPQSKKSKVFWALVHVAAGAVAEHQADVYKGSRRPP